MTTTITIDAAQKPVQVTKLYEHTILSEHRVEPGKQLVVHVHDSADILISEIQGQEGDAPLARSPEA